jgi:hypothetical protein
MAITTYLKDNDYKQLDFKPYELNYEAVLKETAVKQQYWLQGVSKVQNAWKAINDLDPINEDNRANLKQFNDETKGEFNKLARTDLSLSENQEQIKNIIKPLYDVSNKTSKSILYDSYTNTFYKDEFEKVESYKTRDKGAFYNVNNEKEVKLRAKEYYDLKGYKGEDLADKMEEMYKNKRGYTPYYDYTKTIQTAIDKCPEQASKIPQITSQTYITKSIKQKTFSGLMDCITFAVSQDSKAAQQMAIDGYVKFHDSDGNKNVGALKDFYQNDLRRQVDQTNIAINDLNGQLASLPKNTDPKLIEGYKTMGESLKTQLKNLFSEIETSSDLNYVSGKFDELSSSAWMNGVIAKAALSHNYMNVDVEQEFHEAYLAGVNYLYDNELQKERLKNAQYLATLQMQHAENMKKLENEGKGTSGTPGSYPQGYGSDVITNNEEAKKTYGYTENEVLYNNTLQSLRDTYVSEFTRLKEIAKNEGMDVSTWSIDEKSEGFKNYSAFKEGYYLPKYIDVKTNQLVSVDPKTNQPITDKTPGYKRKSIDPLLMKILDVRRAADINFQMMDKSRKEINSKPEVVKIEKEKKEEFIENSEYVKVVTPLGNFVIPPSAQHDLFSGKELITKNGLKIILNKDLTKDETSIVVTNPKTNKTHIEIIDNINLRAEDDPNSRVTGVRNLFDFYQTFKQTSLDKDDKINKIVQDYYVKNNIFANIAYMNGEKWKDYPTVATLKALFLKNPNKDFSIVSTDGNVVQINYPYSNDDMLKNALAGTKYEFKRGITDDVYFISNLPGLDDFKGTTTANALNNEIQKFEGKYRNSSNPIVIEDFIKIKDVNQNYTVKLKWDKTTGTTIHLIDNKNNTPEEIFQNTPEDIGILSKYLQGLPTN